MNKLLLSICLMIGVNAFAIQPEVGDIAKYRTFDTEDSSFGTNYFEARSLTKYSAEDSTFRIQNAILKKDGTTVEAYADVSIEFLLQEYIPNTSDYCKSQKLFGTLEEVRTPAGKFLTCKVNYGSSIKWVSDQIPFGVVKLQRYSNDGKLKFESLLVGISN